MRAWSFALAFVLATSAAAQESASAPATMDLIGDSLIAPAELTALQVEGRAPQILDVRSEAEYAAGHVPGAIWIPYDQIEARIDELGVPGELIVYCRSGHRAGLAEAVLEANGFHVTQIEGSFQAWQAAEQPIQISEEEHGQTQSNP